jgi:hypothetical protein
VYGEGVTEIANYANYHDESGSQLKEIVIPSTVKKIGSHAFYRTALPSPMLAEGVEEIGESAFYASPAMTHVRIPASVKTMGSNVFAYSTALKEIEFGSAIVGEYCFIGCTGLENVVIPNSVTYIGTGAFYSCSGLKDITLPIEQSGFSIFSCASVETITYTAQDSGVMPARASHPGDAKYYGKTLEYSCRNSVKKIVYGEGVTEIANYANYHNRQQSQLEEIVLPETLRFTHA